MTDKEENHFFVVKLHTGETLFSEVVGINDTQVILRKPLIVSDHSSDGTLSGAMWLPYAEDDSNIALMLKSVFLFEPLHHKFIKFYGSILMQQEIQKIKAEVMGDLEEGEFPEWSEMVDAVAKINEYSEYMTEKFGIERVDTSQFTENAEKHKPMMH